MNRFCGGVISARPYATCSAPADGTAAEKACEAPPAKDVPDSVQWRERANNWGTHSLSRIQNVSRQPLYSGAGRSAGSQRVNVWAHVLVASCQCAAGTVRSLQGTVD